MGRADSETGLIWTTTAFMALFHLGAIAALFFFSWTNLIVAAVLYIFAINLGIGMGYHRLLTHRGYTVPKLVEYFLAVCGTLSLEGGPIGWVGTHRVHHQHSDHDGDPHTPQEGTWWSHVGWIISGKAMHSETIGLARYVPDLTRDRFYLWLSKYHWIPMVTVAVALITIGTLAGGIKVGIGLFLWGIFLRVTLGLHATWLVNSATHLWGSRRFDTKDDSRNSWWVALLTGGEGWHNNHHAHPTSSPGTSSTPTTTASGCSKNSASPRKSRSPSSSAANPLPYSAADTRLFPCARFPSILIGYPKPSDPYA
jgi:stearoyl-CoA desaturase (delta-9 desaturase)